MAPGTGIRRALACLLGSAALVWTAGSAAQEAKDARKPRQDRKAPDDQALIRAAGEAPDKSDEHVTGKAFLSVDRLPGGGTCRVVMILDIEDGWNIKTNPASPKGFIPTQFTVKSKYGTVLKDVRYPEGKKITDAKSGDVHSVYESRVMLYGVLEIPKEAAGQTEELELSVRYQACMGTEKCLVPKTLKLTGKLDVAEPGDMVKQINVKHFAAQAQK